MTTILSNAKTVTLFRASIPVFTSLSILAVTHILTPTVEAIHIKPHKPYSSPTIQKLNLPEEEMNKNYILPRTSGPKNKSKRALA